MLDEMYGAILFFPLFLLHFKSILHLHKLLRRMLFYCEALEMIYRLET